MLLLDFTNIAQQNIPISTAASTHHVSIFKTCFSKFSKVFFLFFGPPLGAPGAQAPIFEFPFSRYMSPYFSRRFDLFFHFIPHGTTFHLLLVLVNIFLRSKVHVRLNLAADYSGSFRIRNSSLPTTPWRLAELCHVASSVLHVNCQSFIFWDC